MITVTDPDQLDRDKESSCHVRITVHHSQSGYFGKVERDSKEPLPYDVVK